MKVEVHWKFADDYTDEIMQYRQVLYAYTDNFGSDIVYIGKADRLTVEDRLKGKHKRDVFEYLKAEFGFEELGVAVGMFNLPKNKRLTSQLITDVESLLIYELEPVANIQCVISRKSRPSMIVECHGEWPYKYNCFVDD